MPKTSKTPDKAGEARSLQPDGGWIPSIQLLSVFVPGRPVPQGSMRALGKGRMTHSQPQLVAWRTTIGWACRAALRLQEPTAADVAVTVDFGLRPRRQGDSPDLDKLVRAVLDALTGIVWVDDKQVIELDAVKHVNPTVPEGVLITVETP